MLKLLLLLLAVVVVGGGLWLARRESLGQSKAAPKLERMTACAHCGVNLPLGEALMDGEHAYCSQAHQQAGPRS